MSVIASQIMANNRENVKAPNSWSCVRQGRGIRLQNGQKCPYVNLLNHVSFLCTLTLYVLNIRMHLQLIPSLHTDTTQVDEILSHVRQELTCSTWSLISWVLMPWRCKEPGHQQPWCWLFRTGKFGPRTLTVNFNKTTQIFYWLNCTRHCSHVIVLNWSKPYIAPILVSDLFFSALMLPKNYFWLLTCTHAKFIHTWHNGVKCKKSIGRKSCFLPRFPGYDGFWYEESCNWLAALETVRRAQVHFTQSSLAG